jgi:pimeloyl-ACP methyl ester carboxylesterase
VSASRRALLGGIAAGAAAAFARPSAVVAHPETPVEIVSSEYWAQKSAVRLYVYRKRPKPYPGTRPQLPVLFLVHGSSISSRPSFDLSVPGKPNYSMMDYFANVGFDVWTMDHENYGRSSRTSGNSDIASGVEDLRAAMNVVVRETGASKAHFAGDSSGALRAASFAVAAPERVDRLVLFGFVWTGKGAPTLGNRAQNVEFYRTHNMRPADRELFRSILTRDKVGTADLAVADAIADAQIQYGNAVPTGTYLDMVTKLPLVDPANVKAPTLIVRGEYDGIATVEDVLAFFERLPSADKQFVIIPGAAHSLLFAYNRDRFWFAVNAFLQAPQRQDKLG